MILRSILTTVIAIMTFTSCSNSIDHYQSHRPKLQPEVFFDGQLKASGVVKNFSGKVIRWFDTDIHAYWENGIGTLEEDFVFNDGEQQRRVWTLTPKASDTSKQQQSDIKYYSGTAADVIGSANIKLSGNALFLDYVLRLPYKDSTLDVKVDDKMYLSSDKVIINESVLYKFGIPVGSITLTIYKL